MSKHAIYRCFLLWLLVFVLGISAAGQSKTATSISLVVSSGGHAVTGITSGARTVLTASVSAGTTGIRTGQVNFCDASASYCTDIHLLGVAQLTSAGTASISLRPAVGSHHYKAVFLGTNAHSTSVSSTSVLSVTGIFPSTTTIAQSGLPGNYTLTATVSASAKSLPGPTGKVSFLDTSNNNAVLSTAQLGNAVVAPTLVNVSNPQTGNEPSAIVAGDFNGDGNLDLAVAVNETSQSVSILLGDGAGNFTEVTKSPITAKGNPVLVQDFNGDGIPDILLSSGTSGLITILLGNGDGTFTVAPGSPSGTTSERLMEVVRLIANPSVLRRFLRWSLTEVPSLRRSYLGFIGTTNLSATPHGPACLSRVAS